ncbi:MAG: HEAT repeat domain-containing protein, partial [Gemmataceae bacterium]|nr:HEAT repeat domain-containing protein [Gemmataceae bacterium]
MYCAGLIGMATAVARREERRQLKAEAAPAPKSEPSGGAGSGGSKSDKPADPFFNPPGGKDLPKAGKPAKPADVRDAVVQRAFAGLAITLIDQIRNKGLLIANGGGHGTGDLYFLWSLERACVVFGLEKLGGLDWYDVGSTVLVRSQDAGGTWGNVGGHYGSEVNTAFAVLFLCKSNLARDLSSKVQKDPTSTEMRAGAGASAADLLPTRPRTQPAAPAPVLNLPNPTNDEGIALAVKLLQSEGADWAKLLADTRNAKGAPNTRALVAVATHSDGDRKAAAREALAERLCRMTPATLREMLKADEPELRRAAALACAMKDDKGHIPDLIEALADPDDAVVRAAKAGLKSFSGKDLGPASGATSEQKAAAQNAWREWAKEKK